MKPVKKYTLKEIAESVVFPLDYDKRQNEVLLDNFRALRKHIGNRQNSNTKKRAQLLQLKYLMEEFLHSAGDNDQFYFGYFLKEYISRVNRNNKDFAKEIDVNPSELSLVLNRRRKPTEKLIYRLDIHSNKNFPATTWFAVLEKERALELLRDKSIIDAEKSHVKNKLDFSL